jgi:hypothetical protein
MKFSTSRVLLIALIGFLALATVATAQDAPLEQRSEANLILPDLGSVQFLGMSGHNLLIGGLFVCVLGMLFGVGMYMRLKGLPVHRSMREISELIYETCKTYLITQGKFILILEVFIGAIMVVYFGVLRHYDALRVIIILAASLVGIAGSYTVVRHPDQHVRQLPYGVRLAERETVPDVLDPSQGRDLDRHAADLHRADDHALHPLVRAA